MKRRRKPSAALEAGVLLLVFAAAAFFPLAVLPRPRQPFHYMLAGAFATAVALLAGLVRTLIFSGRLRRLASRAALESPVDGARAVTRLPSDSPDR